MKTRQSGMTLIEVMIVAVIIAVLAAVAYPSYRDYVIRSRRSDAKAGLLAAAQAMERFHTENNTYAGATLGSTGIYPNISPEGYYDLSNGTPTVNAFTLTATPRSPHADAACGNFTYTQAGVRAVSGSLGMDQCWNR